MKVNTDLLRNWIKEQKETNPHARVDLVKKARISPSFLEKILCGQMPGPQTRFMLAHATGLNENELFPTMDEAA